MLSILLAAHFTKATCNQVGEVTMLPTLFIRAFCLWPSYKENLFWPVYQGRFKPTLQRLHITIFAYTNFSLLTCLLPVFWPPLPSTMLSIDIIRPHHQSILPMLFINLHFSGSLSAHISQDLHYLTLPIFYWPKLPKLFTEPYYINTSLMHSTPFPLAHITHTTNALL